MRFWLLLGITCGACANAPPPAIEPAVEREGSQCREIGERCHALAHHGGEGAACHDLGHRGDEAICEREQSRCLAVCERQLQQVHGDN